MTYYVVGGIGFCWGCDVTFWPDAHPSACPECDAPQWAHGNQDDPAGVYIVRAECGLAKIGVSTNVRVRVHELSLACHERLELLAVLRGAGRAIEAWLHGAFSDTRDPAFARAEELAAPTEWFWPTPALLRLAHNRRFLVEGLLWEDAVEEGLAGDLT